MKYPNVKLQKKTQLLDLIIVNIVIIPTSPKMKPNKVEIEENVMNFQTVPAETVVPSL